MSGCFTAYTLVQVNQKRPELARMNQDKPADTNDKQKAEEYVQLETACSALLCGLSSLICLVL